MSLYFDGTHTLIKGIDEATFESMATLGLAVKRGIGYELTDTGESWLKGWCADKLMELGATELQLPLEGMDGMWIVVIEEES